MGPEGVIVLLIFAGSSAVAIAYSPIGKAIAHRIRGPGAGPALLDDLDDQRARLAELEGRIDFAERALAAGADAERAGRDAPRT